MIGKYQTYEHYERALRNRLDNLVKLYNKHKEEEYPFKVRMLGFPMLKLLSRKELKERIKELADVLHLEVNDVIDYGRYQIEKQL